MKDALIMFAFVSSFMVTIAAPAMVLGMWGIPISFVFFIVHAAIINPSAGTRR